MLFWTKAAVCIGIVAVAASNAGGGGLAPALDRDIRGAAKTASRACLESSDCLRIGAGLLAASAPSLGPRAAGPAVVPAPPPRAAPSSPRPLRRTERASLHAAAAARS